MFPDRRAFLKQSAFAIPTLAAVGSLVRGEGGASAQFPGMIVRSTEPQNLEFPFAQLSGAITPNEHFYVRNHFPMPKIDLKSWKLRVEGAVKNPLELTYDDILKLASSTLTATLECAGNGRVFLTPTAPGTLWSLGAVSTAKWKGVTLATLLEKAGVKESAVEVILEGADRGQVSSPPSPGVIPFHRSLPLKKALQPEVLLAYQMNDVDLPAAHGHPLRAVVGGWYGMAGVKWLTRIIVAEKPFDGFWQTLEYTYFKRSDSLPDLVPVTRMEVKSSIAQPGGGEIVPAGMPYRVFGAAWSGDASIARVEVSTDGGKTWRMTKLLDKSEEWAWSLWDFNWQVPATKGPVQLLSRATDSKGRIQPLKRDPDRRNYMISHCVPVEVVVK